MMWRGKEGGLRDLASRGLEQRQRGEEERIGSCQQRGTTEQTLPTTEGKGVMWELEGEDEGKLASKEGG
jgi:hypothetical protein